MTLSGNLKDPIRGAIRGLIWAYLCGIRPVFLQMFPGLALIHVVVWRGRGRKACYNNCLHDIILLNANVV